MPWYRLPASLQRHVLCGIHNVQNGAVLSIGPLGQLDFTAAADVSLFVLRDGLSVYIKYNCIIPLFQLTKLIYRFTMLLFTTLN